MDKIFVKNDSQISLMAEGGKKLARIKKELRKMIQIGTKASDIEGLAQELIKKEGGEASFTKVPGYHWATCINVNEGLVHGIPKKEIVFKKGDVIKVDLGFFYKGFHTDSSFSLGLGIDEETKNFLEVGKVALKNAINQARSGKRIFDISEAIEKTVSQKGYSPIEALVGHGVGKSLHEGPQIPCFRQGKKDKSPEIVPGMTLAIEVMYSQGSPEIKVDKDGWTIFMRDGKIAALYEETVAVTLHGPFVLTE